MGPTAMTFFAIAEIADLSDEEVQLASDHGFDAYGDDVLGCDRFLATSPSIEGVALEGKRIFARLFEPERITVTSVTRARDMCVFDVGSDLPGPTARE